MAAFDSDALHRFLTNSLSKKDFHFSRLETDGTNQHYQVHSDKDYFLKVFNTNSLQVVERRQQFLIQTQLASRNLAPKPLALSECQQFWLEEWYEGQECNQSPKLLCTEKIRKLAHVMVSIHQSSIDAPLLDLEAEWLRYLNIAGAEVANYSNDINTLKAAYEKEIELCFCHNDLHISHILSWAPTTVIDWEYAAMGNRYFDLAACFMVNNLEEGQVNEFIEQYAKLSLIGERNIREGIQRMLPVIDFTNKLWQNAYTQVK